MTKHSSELFTVTFIGEYVEIICKTSEEEQGKLVVKGYLLDIDSDYYYLGANPLEVSTVVKKNWVGLISIVEDIDPSVEILENMELPDVEN